MRALTFKELISGNNQFLQPIAYSFTGNYDDAQDLVQETMARAISNSEKYKEGTNIKAWLYTIMRNIYINAYRKNKRFKKVNSEVPDDYYFFQMNKVAVNTGAMQLQVKEMKSAIYELPEIFRLSFELHYQGYKYQEIAEMLAEPIGTIKSRIHFARKLLMAKIGKS